MPNTVTWPAKALLFDCDGVLVDSAATVERSWSTWASRYGMDGDEVNAIVLGRRVADSVSELVSADQRDEAIALIQSLELGDASTTTAIPGAVDLVRELPLGTWAAVTSGTTSLASARLRAAGIPVPSVLVTADDVEAGKPAPDGYLKAAALLGFAIDQCIVLEDSPAGIGAGRAAGVSRVVGIGEGALETDADAVVPDLTALWWEAGTVHVDTAALLRPAAD